MICFSSFVVLIIEMELETFKITVLPLRQKMLNFSRRLVEDAADAEDVVQAEITATPVENVRVNLSRARKKIREQFLQLNKQEKWT